MGVTQRQHVPETHTCPEEQEVQASPPRGDYEQVMEFTKAIGDKIYAYPRPMGELSVLHLTNMVIDELMELLATVFDPDRAKEIVKTRAERTRALVERGYEDTMAAQMDAMVDIYYYMLHSATQHGMWFMACVTTSDCIHSWHLVPAVCFERF